MKKVLIPLLMAIIFSFCSCEWLEENIDEEGLSQEDVVEGLKKALELGTDTATSVLGLTNGYFGNKLYKIPLPPDVEKVRSAIENNNTLNSVANTINLHQKFDDVVLAINRSAENAANEAGPIFKNAIADLSLTDAWDILNGIVPNSSQANEDFDSIAATQYFINTTYTPLVGLFGPKINDALDQDISALGFSAVDAWSSLTSTYNNFMSNTLVQTTLTFTPSLDLPSGLNEDLGGFCTGKALDGLFLRVGLEEKKIRKNPFEWAVDIIKKVFGSVFEESE